MDRLPDRLEVLLRANDGLLARSVALAHHVTPSVIEAAVDAGSLRRVRPGVFADGSIWDAAQPSEKFRLMVRAALLGHPCWLASHHAALAWHGLPLHDVDLATVDVVAPVRTSKKRPGLRVHVADPTQLKLANDPESRAVTPSDACVLTAAASGFEAGVVAMDAALQRRLVTSEGLRASLALRGARYGVGVARAAIDAADPKAESPGESLTRLVLVTAGLEVRSQVTIEDRHGFIGRVDLLVGGRVVVEFDGAVKYDGLDGRRELMREKRREERLRDAGYRVVRVTWAELASPERLVRRVVEQLAA